MADIITNGTVDSITKYASTEYNLISRIKYITTTNPLLPLDYVAKDIVEQKYDVSFIRPSSSISDGLNNILKYIMLYPTYEIEIVQVPTCPYIFSFGFYYGKLIDLYYFPLLTARKLLYILKTYKSNITIAKIDKSLASERTILFRDLCFRGKSDISIPAYDYIANIAKKVKLTINGWITPLKENKEDEDNTISQSSIRFRGAEWFQSAQEDVVLIGAGGLGSNIAVSLCRVIGNRILSIYDPDIIEYKNLAGQNFGWSDIGKEKCAVVGEQCSNFNPLIKVDKRDNSFDEFPTAFLPTATITGLDNMASRSYVYYKWKEKVDTNSFVNKVILIDSRLSAETWQVFCITSDNKKAQEEYENKWLFSDEEADAGVCTYKQTAYAAQMCASFVTNLYINFCTNLAKKEDDPTNRFLPFMTEYDASQMILRFQNI